MQYLLKRVRLSSMRARSSSLCSSNPFEVFDSRSASAVLAMTTRWAKPMSPAITASMLSPIATACAPTHMRSATAPAVILQSLRTHSIGLAYPCPIHSSEAATSAAFIEKETACRSSAWACRERLSTTSCAVWSCAELNHSDGAAIMNKDYQTNVRESSKILRLELQRHHLKRP